MASQPKTNTFKSITVNFSNNFSLYCQILSKQLSETLSFCLIGPETLSYYYRSFFTFRSLPFQLSNSLTSLDQLFALIYNHSQHLSIVWQDRTICSYIVLILKVSRGGEEIEFKLRLHKQPKTAQQLIDTKAKRKIAGVKLKIKEINVLKSVLDHYRRQKNRLQCSRLAVSDLNYPPQLRLAQQSLFKRPFAKGSYSQGQQNSLKKMILQDEQGKRKIVLKSHGSLQDHNQFNQLQDQGLSQSNKLGNRKIQNYKSVIALISGSENASPDKQRCENSAFPDQLALQKPHKERVAQINSIEQGLAQVLNKDRRGTEETNKRSEEQLKTVELKTEMKTTKEQEQSNARQRIYVRMDFAKNNDYEQFQYSLKEEGLEVTRLSDHPTFYHIYHKEPITRPMEYFRVVLININKHDFTVGILGKSAIHEPRKAWPLHFIAYVGCTYQIIRGLAYTKVPIVFQANDELIVAVSRVQKKIYFFRNDILISKHDVPSAILKECYFFYQTATKGNKVLFPLFPSNNRGFSQLKPSD